jgi:hypothetical protein
MFTGLYNYTVTYLFHWYDYKRIWLNYNLSTLLICFLAYMIIL